ncbi:MAG TPA: FlgD immunoglobulin-like domain containing protein [Fimbriimonadaceae bacterium]|nr:FlgD immunoglobulin-like domain containing protein [Fimbriimonadaceae bacterium]
MNNVNRKILGLALVMGLGVTQAAAQLGWWVCYDTNETTPPPPHSNDWGVLPLFGTSLFRISLGLSGNTTYGGGTNPGPCFQPAAVMNARGRIGFAIGEEGSVQSSFDDNLQLTMGMPVDIGGTAGYATSTRDGARTLFGQNGFTLQFVGASHRYFVAETINDSVRVRLQVDVLGDAARLRWTLTNLDNAASHGLGLWFGQWVAMFAQQPDPATGAITSGGIVPLFVPGVTPAEKEGYVTIPTGRPPRTDQRWIRATNPAEFPNWVNFNFGQTSAFGLRLENGPSEATREADFNGLPTGPSDATEVAEFALGKHIIFGFGGLLASGGTWSAGLGSDGTFPDNILPDTEFLYQQSYIQKFAEQPVPPGGSRVITAYYRGTTMTGNYSRPYSVVVDGPKLLATDNAGVNGLEPNPFTIRVYVDNTSGFSGVNTEVPLNDVKVSISLPPGLSLSGGDQPLKIIPVAEPSPDILPFVEFLVEADGIVNGELQYSVTVEPTPGPKKTVFGRVQVSSTPRLELNEGPNFVTVPWLFTDTSWEAILGLNSPQDFQAFVWDPEQQGYVISTSAERGKGVWLIMNDEFGSHPLQSNPQVPPDVVTGAPLTQLKDGWNMIGNPYPYAIPLSQLVGVSAANPQQSFTWLELVNQGIVSGSLAYWDEDAGTYRFIDGPEAVLQPNVGYWLFVFTAQDFTLSWPPVFAEFLPGSTRSRSAWVQSDKQWRLALVARTNNSIDDENYVGQAATAADATRLRRMEPPMNPVQTLSVFIEGMVNGRSARLAQSLSDTAGRKEWKVVVQSTQPGDVTLTWPNLSTVPKNTRWRLIDVATNTVRDLRQTSGYTFTMNEAGTREFKIQVESGGVARPTIGNVLVARDGRGASSSFTITYTLSTSATTSVRILSGSGKEVYTATRGRADSAGENRVTWNLRDNANRAVAPGTYRVEILAEGEGGERVRKFVPINVTR